MKLHHTLHILLCLLSLVIVNPLYASLPHKNETVILLHGILRSDCSMERLERAFQVKGYQTINIDYPSRKFSIEDLTQQVYEQLPKAQLKQSNKIHFVCHSMGCLISRNLIQQYHLKPMGRVVMMGPPNQGSEVADVMKKYLNGIFKWLYGPAGQQLGTDEAGFWRQLKPVNYEVGIIAGDRSINPIAAFVLPGKDDGEVSIKRAHVPGEKDFIVIHATHTFMIANKNVIKQAVNFIELGYFTKH